jgi:DNA-binding NarL/FixJ family response regulator
MCEQPVIGGGYHSVMAAKILKYQSYKSDFIMPKKSKSGAKPKRRIFLVEDHPIFCDGIKHLINAENDMEVCGIAADGETALKKIVMLEPDLALVDLGLPKKSGLELIKDLRARKLPVKLLVVSMFDEAIYAQRVLRAGGDGYIMKQEDPPEIINAIRDVLNGHIYVSEEVMAMGTADSGDVKRTDDANPLKKLADSELEILELLGGGKSNEQIARKFQFTASEFTAKCLEIQQKLGLECNNALIRFAVCWVEGSTG